MRNLFDWGEQDDERVRRYLAPGYKPRPQRGPEFNQSTQSPNTPALAMQRGDDDSVALARRIREKQKSDELIASNSRMVSAARKSSDHTDLAKLHADAVRDKGDGALAELGDFACQLHKADPAACKSWKQAMSSELPGEMKRLVAAVERMEAEDTAERAKKPPSDPGKTIHDTVKEMLDPDIAERGTLLPIGKDKDGNREFPVLPETAIEALKAVMLPVHVLKGGTVTEQDVTNMALSIAGGGLTTKTPKDALRNGFTRLRGDPKFMRKIDLERQGKEAAAGVMAGKTSKPQSMFREDVGEITFDFGTKKSGMQHINRQRMRKDGMTEEEANAFVRRRVPEILANGKLIGFVTRHGDRRAIIEDRSGRVVLTMRHAGQKEKWIISAYEKF